MTTPRKRPRIIFDGVPDEVAKKWADMLAAPPITPREAKKIQKKNLRVLRGGE